MIRAEGARQDRWHKGPSDILMTRDGPSIRHRVQATNRITPTFAWMRGLISDGGFDNMSDAMAVAEAREKACIEMVEAVT
jgi:hypothetical protein